MILWTPYPALNEMFIGNGRQRWDKIEASLTSFNIREMVPWIHDYINLVWIIVQIHDINIK